jgi:hypothetical protein
MKKRQAIPVKKAVKQQQRNPATKVARRAPAAISATSVRQNMASNAASYVASLQAPFTIRNMRLPDPSGFPTTSGYFQQRLQLTAVDDSNIAYPSIVGLFLSPTFQNPISSPPQAPIQTVGFMALGTPTWSQATWQNMVTFSAGFLNMRITSCGFRFINTAAMLNRGGTGYVATVKNTQLPLTAAAVAQLLASTEAKQFDIGQLPEMGDEFTWSPQVLRPESAEVVVGGGATTLDNFLTFHPPANTQAMYDNSLFLWVSFPKAEDSGINLAIEIAVNYEAVPFPQDEFLFERQTVVGSPEDLAVAREVQTAQSNPSTATAGNFKSAEQDSVGSIVRGGVQGFKKGGIKGALVGAGKAILPQIPSLLKSVLGGLGSIFSAQDVSNHKVAAHLGALAVSPVHNPSTIGLSQTDFMLRVVNHLAAEEIEEKSTPAPPPSPSALREYETKVESLPLTSLTRESAGVQLPLHATVSRESSWVSVSNALARQAPAKKGAGQ